MRFLGVWTVGLLAAALVVTLILGRDDLPPTAEPAATAAAVVDRGDSAPAEREATPAPSAVPDPVPRDEPRSEPADAPGPDSVRATEAAGATDRPGTPVAPTEEPGNSGGDLPPAGEDGGGPPPVGDGGNEPPPADAAGGTTVAALDDSSEPAEVVIVWPPAVPLGRAVADERQDDPSVSGSPFAGGLEVAAIASSGASTESHDPPRTSAVAR